MTSHAHFAWIDILRGLCALTIVLLGILIECYLHFVLNQPVSMVTT